MNCKICNKEFIPNVHNQKYCSKECFKINREKYQKSERYKEYRRKYKKTDKYKEYDKEYQQTEKYKKYQKEYRLKNKENHKKYQKEYNKTYTKIEKFKKYLKEYNKTYTKTEKYKETQKKYRQTLKGKISYIKHNHKRRALKRNCPNEDYKEQLRQVKQLKTFTCYWCGKKYDIKDLHLDHIIPLSKGGSDTWSNIALSCYHCNCSKHNKLPEEFNKTLEQPRLFI